MNYLQLVQELVDEVGVAGDSALPASVVGQTSDIAKIVRYVREATLYVENLWTDWTFLWREHSLTLTAGTATPALPTAPPARAWEHKGFYLNLATSSPIVLQYLSWAEFRPRFLPGVPTAGQPTYITVQPNGVLRLNRAGAVDYSFRGEYWAQPQPMTANEDTPLVPVEFHRVVLARAGVMYGEREDAPEHVDGYMAEYLDLLEKLEAMYLPDRYDRQSQAPEEFRVSTR